VYYWCRLLLLILLFLYQQWTTIVSVTGDHGKNWYESKENGFNLGFSTWQCIFLFDIQTVLLSHVPPSLLFNI